jgi:Flp pilus assembly protein TadD
VTDDAVRSRKFFSVLRLLVLLLVSAAALRAQDTGNIAGQVRLQNGSFPNDRIQIDLEGRGSLVNRTYCDFEGRFGFNDLLPNSYYVVIEAEGYQPVRQQVVINPRFIQTNVVHVVLRRSEEKPRESPDGLPGSNGNLVDVSDFAKKYPPSVLKEFEAGRKAEERRDSTSAAGHFQEALRLAPDFYPARNNLGTLYMKKGDLEAAEQEFRQVVEQDRNSGQAYFNLGNVLYLTRRYDEAKRILEDGLRREPTSAMGYYLLGSVLVRLDDLKGAEERFRAAREFDPKMPQAPIALATLYLQTGRQREASDMFESFLRQFPKDPMVPKVRDALNKLSHPPSP